MQDQLISFETAKLAKEKGFKIPTTVMYKGNEKSYGHNNEWGIDEKRLDGKFPYTNQQWYSIPTQSLLQKWLREVHNIHVNIFCDYDRKDETYNTYWNCNIILLNWGEDREQYVASKIRNFNNKFEEAYEIGLQEALKLI